MTRVLALSALALTFIPSASATESTIYPGVGIGKVKLGMTKAQVVHVLGNDYIVDSRNSTSVALGWNFDSWTATFVMNHVVQVGVTVRSQRTTSGIGSGSTWRQLVHAYPHGVCTTAPYGFYGAVEYLVPHRGGTQTIYVVTFPKVSGRARWRVIEVRVRTPFQRLPEFAPDWPGHCRKDWRTADVPFGY
jgi:hypothetical protein